MLEFKLQNALLRNELSNSECLQSQVIDAWRERDSALYDCGQIQQELDQVQLNLSQVTCENNELRGQTDQYSKELNELKYIRETLSSSQGTSAWTSSAPNITDFRLLVANLMRVMSGHGSCPRRGLPQVCLPGSISMQTPITPDILVSCIFDTVGRGRLYVARAQACA